MRPARQLLVLICCGGVLAGCAGALSWNPPGAHVTGTLPEAQVPMPRHYTVRPGDTLYSIAWRYGLDYHDLASWNGIGSAYLIKPGERLVLEAPNPTTDNTTKSVIHSSAAATQLATAPPASNTPSSAPLHWVWPTQGALVRLYHAGDPLSKGIDISGVEGQYIDAAASGRVVYTGSAIIGYGKLIIIKNSDRLLSAYADNEEMLVKEGDRVKAGERIATMGLDRNGHALLHFEIRYGGKPVNPLNYLPSR